MLTRKEAAKLLGYSVQALKRWATLPDLNGLPFVRSPSGRVRYSSLDLDAWLTRHRKVKA